MGLKINIVGKDELPSENRHNVANVHFGSTDELIEAAKFDFSKIDYERVLDMGRLLKLAENVKTKLQLEENLGQAESFGELNAGQGGGPVVRDNVYVQAEKLVKGVHESVQTNELGRLVETALHELGHRQKLFHLDEPTRKPTDPNNNLMNTSLNFNGRTSLFLNKEQREVIKEETKRQNESEDKSS